MTQINRIIMQQIEEAKGLTEFVPEGFPNEVVVKGFTSNAEARTFATEFEGRAILLGSYEHAVIFE